MLLLNINPELCKCVKRAVSTKRMSFVKDYRTLIFHDNLTLIIDFKSKSCSPNQLARRTAATPPPPGGQRFFFVMAARSGRRSRPTAGENVKQYYSPAGGGARFGGLPAKVGKGQILPSRTPVRLRLGQPTRTPLGWWLNAIRNRKHTRLGLSSAGQPGSTGSVQGCRKPY